MPFTIPPGVTTHAALTDVSTPHATADVASAAITQTILKTKSDSDFTTTSGTFTDVTGATQAITTTGGSVLIEVSGMNSAGTVNTSKFIQVLRDTTVVAGAGSSGGHAQIYLTQNAANTAFSFVALDATPAAGSYTYKLQLKSDGSNNQTIVANTTWGVLTMRLTELKR